MPSYTGIAATDIAQALLEETGNALLEGNFNAFCVSFHVPQTMATMAGLIYMETVEDMRRAFDQMHNHFKELGVTELVRNCVAAEFKTPTKIESTHVTRVMREDDLLNVPYPSFSVLEKIGDQWKVTGSEYALEPDNGQAVALAQADASMRAGAAER